MAASVPQAGAIVFCPSCGTEVMQKEMIPTGMTGDEVSYLCVACCRKLLRTGGAQTP